MAQYVVKCRDCSQEPFEVKLTFEEFDKLKYQSNDEDSHKFKEIIRTCGRCDGFKFRVIPQAFSFRMS